MSWKEQFKHVTKNIYKQFQVFFYNLSLCENMYFLMYLFFFFLYEKELKIIQFFCFKSIPKSLVSNINALTIITKCVVRMVKKDN